MTAVRTDPIDATVDAFAVFRLTKLVIDDEIFADVREKFLENHSPEETKLGYFVTCPWCVSIWAGALVVTARAVAPRTWGLISQALAFSTLSGIAYTQL